MLFAIDVGNTNITIGLFDGKKLVNKFRMITQTDRTSDEYGVFLGEWLFVNHMKPADITDVIISSVVPNIIGADRLVDAVAAYEIYGGPIIVIDFGTATTHDLVLGDGTFYAGVTSPGIRLAANALWRGTAKLPEVEIKKVDTILGRDTVSSMQAGIYFGYIGQTEYIIKKLKKDSNLPDIKVVATGGLGKLISEATDQIDVYDPELTLHGLRIIYDKQ